MKALSPISITSAMLVGASVAENDHPEWLGAAAYAAGARVIRASTHRIYERQVAGSGTAAPEADDTVWLDVGPTNRWAMLDESPSTSTTASGSISVTLAPGLAVGDIVLSGVIGSSVSVSANGSTVRTASVSAIVAPSTSSDLTISGLGISAGAQVGITVTGSGTVSVGTLLFGTMIDLGETLPGAQVGITDYSTTDTNTYGITSIIRRQYSRRIQCSVRIPTTDVDRVSAVLDDLRSRVCWWSADASYSALQVAGWYKDWSIEIKGATETVYSITVEGLARDDVSIAPEAGNLSAPPVITGAAAAMVPGGVLVSWDQSADSEWAGSEWRVGASWAAGARIFRGSATDFVWLSPAQGSQTLWGVNLDSTGEESAPVSLSLTIDGSVLTVSIGGGNQLFNSDFGLGWRGWTSVNGGSPGTREINKPDWTLSATTPISGTTVAVRNGAPTAGYHEEWSDPIPVTPLDWYCASAYTGVVGCRVAVFAYFYGDSATLSNSYGPPATCENYSATGGGALAGYKRIYGVGQAPGAAKFARLVIRKYGTVTGQSSSYAFACRAMFEQVGSAGATPGPWSPGPLGYSGDLDATIGAPVGTMVGGREAGAAIQSIDTAQAAADTAQGAAAASQQSANAALTRLQAIDSDGVLARGEKQSVVMDWTELWNSRQGVVDSAAIYGVSSVAFTDALSALSTYLLSLSPGWSDTSQDTTIIPATFRTLWDAAYQSRTATLNAVAAKAKQLVDAAAVAASNAQAAAAGAQTSANAALGRLQAQASDGILSALEKKSTLVDWSEISGARNGIVAQANVYGIITERDAYTSAVTALSDYLTSLSPSWADTSQDTTIIPAVWRATWDAAYQRRQDLLNKIYSSAKALADQANLGVADINSDSKWSPVEKAALVVDWQELDGSKAPLIAQANVYGITAERDAMDVAISDLGTYLASLTPGWSDTSQTTTIVRSVADSKWASAYAARRALEVRIADEAGKRATWTTVTGAGRPQDNATVGAAFGSNISGQIVPATLTQYVAANTIHESASLALSGALTVNTASPTVSANAAGNCLVIVNGAITIGDEPNSSNPATTGRLALIVNGVTSGYSVICTGRTGQTGGSLTFTAVSTWSGPVNGTISAQIFPQRITGSQQVTILSGATISIISLKG